MNTTTFTATFTFQTDSIIGFAKFIGYKEQIQDTSTPITSPPTLIPNPETALDFVARMAKEHNEEFVTKWANTLVSRAVRAQVEPVQVAATNTANTQILQPVKDAIQVTYISN